MSNTKMVMSFGWGVMLAQDGTIMNVLDWQIFLMIRGYAHIVIVVTSIIFVTILTLNLLRLHLVVQLHLMFIG